MAKEKLFALDIGTRSVVGLILEQEDKEYRVLDLIVREHTDRSMEDGQIHDIVAVAKVIKEVKETLEEKHGPLTKVCVAAAGRSLKTERATAEIQIKNRPILTEEDILLLELAAVQNAQREAAKKQTNNSSHTYYCVGYSVLHYYLDNEIIGNLIDQQGEVASVEIIATFLPRTVVDSLLKTLERAGLELEAMTLEPIAAINVLVPTSMRRLNIALVDIGAGTSDIAVTNAGTVIAYGMVPSAGDEITEAISDELLLDFPEAEKAKRQLWEQDSIVVQDILGFETEFTKSEIVEKISPAIERLAEEISQHIIELNNGKAPKAVMLVGGGSMTPDLPKRLAEKLRLPENRVAIRGADAIQGLTLPPHLSNGPDYITPIGIALSARKSPIQYVTITINDRPTHLFAVQQLTVSDCLLASGIHIQKLYGKPGLAKIITFNEQPLTIPGTFGEAPTILKNGKECSLDEIVQDGDNLTINKGKDGQPSNIKIKDLLDDIPERTVTINGKAYTVPIRVTKNGNPATIEDSIHDKDRISVHVPETIAELVQELQLTELISMLHPFKIVLNGKEIILPQFSGEISLNGKLVKSSEKLPTKKIELNIIRKKEPTGYNISEALQKFLEVSIQVYYHHQPITLTKAIGEFYRQGKKVNPEDIIYYGDHLEYKEYGDAEFIFQDIFKYVDVEKPKQATGSFILKVNNKEATFYTPIKNGDQLEIIWPSSVTK